MGKRREARERAVQFLFQHDLNPPEDLTRALEQFWETQRAAAIAEEKGAATWGQPVELPPPSAEDSAAPLPGWQLQAATRSWRCKRLATAMHN